MPEDNFVAQYNISPKRMSAINALQEEIRRREDEIKRLKRLLTFLSSVEDEIPKEAEEALWSMVTLLGSERVKRV